MFVIQPRRRRAGDEELAAVRVRAGVGHGEYSRAGVFDGERFVRERLVVVDARAARAVGVEEVAALDHESFHLRGR